MQALRWLWRLFQIASRTTLDTTQYNVGNAQFDRNLLWYTYAYARQEQTGTAQLSQCVEDTWITRNPQGKTE